MHSSIIHTKAYGVPWCAFIDYNCGRTPAARKERDSSPAMRATTRKGRGNARERSWKRKEWEGWRPRWLGERCFLGALPDPQIADVLNHHIKQAGKSPNPDSCRLLKVRP
jgi:hypothetical protein